MLLVRDSMTEEVVCAGPDAMAAEALALIRDKRIRHLPVLEEGRLVGIVSGRDLRSAPPALGDQARSKALEQTTVSGVMVRGAITAHPDDPIEQAANVMREKKVGCLPVVEGGELVGILTSSDVMKALACLVGAHEPGSRLEIVLLDRPGTLADVAGIFRDADVNIVSVVVAPEKSFVPGEKADERVAVFRVGTINPSGAVERLEDAGYRVLWPPKA